MTDEPISPDPAPAPTVAPEIRDDEGELSPDFLAALNEAIAASDAERVQALAGDLHSADLADLIEAFEPEARIAFIRLLGDQFDFAALTEIDDSIRAQLLDELKPAEVAQGVAELDSDDAVYILEDLGEEDRQEVLAQIPVVDRIAIARGLDYPEDSVGRRMQTDVIAVPPFWTVGQTLDYMREAEDLPDDFLEVFVVDPSFRVLGSVKLNRLLRSKRPVRMSEIMEEAEHVVHAATDDLEEAARIFERYDLVAAPVVDDAERLVGVLTIDNVVDVLQDEADEDMRRLGGVGDEEISDSILTSSRSRLPWLAVNAVTGFVAAGVIGLFDGTIEEMVALAVLMPIVATLGGSTGTQAMTVTVRAIATRDLARRKVRRVVIREGVVGFLNGLVIALLVGAGAWLWFGRIDLGFVIALAIVFNMLVAGLAGVLFPLLLNRLKLDPAVASGVFVTTVTDVIGFFAFLGLATLWFGLG
ncbi:MAG: magnesium transporter [Bauldia sp.]|nr:magnesium transporter [Bauldia sp.]